jgi:hypothetical protein
MKAIHKGVFSRSFKVADRDTSEELKPMDLNHLVQHFDIIEKFAETFGYKFRYFTSNPENVRTVKDGTKVELRPKDIKKEGYGTGFIWVYDPFDSHGAFNDQLYTKVWRQIHELAHAISEDLMEVRYGWSRRFGAMNFNTRNPYDINDKKVYKGLSLLQAQRALEWEDVAFRTQVLLYKELGLKIPKGTASLDFNIAAHDVIIRVLTGDFSDPGSVGVLPNSNQKVSVRDALQFLENQYKANAEHLGKEPEKGIDLSTWKQYTTADIVAQIKKAEKAPKRDI